VVKVPADRFTWNPAQPPGPHNRLYGPGIATYRSTADGQVALDYVESTGRTGRWLGPLPAEFAEPGRSTRTRHSGAKPVAAAVGFLVGLLITSGATEHALLVAVSLALAGWILAGVAVMTTSMVTRTRAFAAQRP
jgi:hypothetical protein